MRRISFAELMTLAVAVGDGKVTICGWSR